MPSLHWIGKEKVINHHRDVPFRILEHKFGFNVSESETNNVVNSENKIIHGDNLLALKSLLPEFEGKIKCIYIDPPYNTGNENWVYNDNVNDPKIKKWLGEVVGREGDDLSRHDKWLCMMYPRHKLLHKLLSKDGRLVISIGFEVYQKKDLLQGLSKEAYIATGVVIACLVDFTRLSVYATRFVSADLHDNLVLVISATFAAIAGAFIGSKLLKKVTLTFIQKLVAVMLIIISLTLGFGLI